MAAVKATREGLGPHESRRPTELPSVIVRSATQVPKSQIVMASTYEGVK